MKDMEGKPMESKPSMGEGLSMDEMMEKAMVAAEQKIQAKMDEAMAKRLNAEAPQQLNVNIMQPPQHNNNNNNSMQMQGPTPQRMYTQGPRTGWHSGLFECANDIPVCASRPCSSPLKTARPRPARAHHARRIALHGYPPPHVVQ
jgi:hypothetical protein